MPSISFIIPVRNDAARLGRCLASINERRRPEDEILVIDNGSADASAEVARSAGALVLCLPGLSVSRLRNAGAERAAGGFLAFVDADHQLEEGWTQAVIDGLSRPGIGAVGAAYWAPDPGTWVQRAYDTLRSRSTTPVETSWLGGGNLVVRKDAFVRVGGFDTRFETCEDVDLCNRLREAGWRVLSHPGMRSTHHGDPADLKRLFVGELWRGRDNLRVSLRGALGPRDLFSIAAPIVTLACVLGLPLLPLLPASTATTAIAWMIGIPLSLTLLRGAKMALNRTPGRTVPLSAVLVVAAVYDAARALALVARRGHHRNHRNGAR